jgi:hypothetical protein
LRTEIEEQFLQFIGFVQQHTLGQDPCYENTHDFLQKYNWIFYQRTPILWEYYKKCDIDMANRARITLIRINKVTFKVMAKWDNTCHYDIIG